MGFRAAYISYADYGGPLIHTKEFAKAFKNFVPDLVTYFPNLNENLSPEKPGPETFFNKLFSYFPSWSRRLKLEFFQSRKLLRDMSKWRYLAKLYQQNDIDIIIVRNDAYVMGPIYAAQKQRIPYLLETNGILSKHQTDRITLWFEKYVLTRASGIFAVSDPLAQLLIDLGVPKKKIRVIPNGVNIEAFQSFNKAIVPSQLLQKLQNKIVVGYIGTFTDNHDVSGVVHGFAKALSTSPDLRLLLIGKGMRDYKIKEEVMDLGIKDEIIFVGKIPYDHVSTYINLCHIMVNPMHQVYKEAFIGVPIKMFEYMAAKRPIISTDMPNLRELLGTSALFVPPARPDKWKEALITLAHDTNLRNLKAEQAFKRLKEKKYTWEENARKVCHFCKDILSRNNRGFIK